MDFNKTSIVETDLVLIHIDDKPAFYGRVEQIIPDSKKGWWCVRFLFLTFPHQMTTWVIDDEQIRGADFTMGGTPVRIEKIVVASEHQAAETKTATENDDDQQAQPKARVFSIAPKKDEDL